MKTQTLKQSLTIAGMVLALAGSLHAAPLDVTASPATDAAAQVDDKYGIHIVFKGNLDAQKPISFSVTDADAPGARLQAVNAFANAANADFQKTFVVSKASDGSTNVPADQIDTDAEVVFPKVKMSAEEAAGRIAGADNAVLHISGPVGDTVTFSATTLSTKQAAREFAQQTDTQWKTFYAMTPRGSHLLTGKIVGRTSNGSPIIEEPYVYYKKQSEPPAPVTTAQTSRPSRPQEPGQPQVAGSQDAGNPFNYGSQPYGDPNSAYYYPYGFDTYAGNNPYSQNVYPGGPMYGGSGGDPYGFGGGYDSTGSGLSVSDGFSPPVVFGGGY